MASAFRYPWQGAGGVGGNKPPILGALLRNESGGRNIANTTQGTSSGQAQGYFQITTGTWDDFGGRQYAPNPLSATPEQQWAIAQNIPLNRWDKSTLAAMRATGRQIDPSRTLGENASMNGENFGGIPTTPMMTSGGGPGGGTYTGEAPSAANMAGPTPAHTYGTPEPQSTELTGDDKTKSLGGLMGEMQKNAGVQHPLTMPAFHGGGAAQNGPSLAEIIQQYLTMQKRGGMSPAMTPQPQSGGSGFG